MKKKDLIEAITKAIVTHERKRGLIPTELIALRDVLRENGRGERKATK